MPTIANLRVQVEVFDGQSPVISDSREPTRFTCGASLPVREKVSLAGTAFTELDPPTGAKAVAIWAGGAPSLVLKGVTGDTGVSLTPASAVTDIPLILPLGTTPSLGIYNGGSTTLVDVAWL